MIFNFASFELHYLCNLKVVMNSVVSRLEKLSTFGYNRLQFSYKNELIKQK